MIGWIQKFVDAVRLFNQLWPILALALASGQARVQAIQLTVKGHTLKIAGVKETGSDDVIISVS